MFVLRQESSDPDVHRYRAEESLLQRLNRMVRKEYLRRVHKPYDRTRPKGCEHFRDDRSPYGRDVWEKMPRTDILNLHWVADFIDYGRFFEALDPDISLVWTLHDMNPFTGGCHYDLECGRYAESCGACPQLGSTRDKDLSRAIHQRKERALAALDADKVRIVTGSRWLASAARNSSLLSRFDVTTIHYGVDPQAFSPRERSALRASLNIPDSAFVVLFAADDLSNERKGLNLLLQALHKLPDSSQVYLLSVGAGNCTLETGIPHIHLGYLTSDDMLSIFYSAGDCFIIPSLQEVFGLTALEAMACATPVIGFATGGIPDMVKPGETGLLAPTGNVPELSQRIQWMIDHPDETRAMGERSRLLVEKEFTVGYQARQYTELYNELQKSAETSAR